MSESQMENPHKKLSHKEAKQQRQFEEKIRRVINQNPNLTREQAVHKIMRDDYSSLPLEEKFKRLESVISGMFRDVAKDIRSLQFNDGIIANAMDLNMKSMTRCLELAGVSMEKQVAIMEVVQREFDASIKQEAKARADANEMATLSNIEKQGETNPDDVPPPPDGATVFGG